MARVRQLERGSLGKSGKPPDSDAERREPSVVLQQRAANDVQLPSRCCVLAQTGHWLLAATGCLKVFLTLGVYSCTLCGDLLADA